MKAWKTGNSDGDLLQFESPAALFRVLTAKRWELIERLQTMGPTTIRFEAAVAPPLIVTGAPHSNCRAVTWIQCFRRTRQ